MNDRIRSVKFDPLDIAHIAAYDGELWVRCEKVSEPHYVERGHLVAGLEQLGNENASLVAASTGDEYFHGRLIFASWEHHYPPPSRLLKNASRVLGARRCRKARCYCANAGF